MFVRLNLNKIPVFFYADFSVSRLKNECVFSELRYLGGSGEGDLVLFL